MIDVLALVVILFGHWLSDFVFQPHWMSLRKSKEWEVLFLHSTRIFGVMAVVGSILIYPVYPSSALAPNFNLDKAVVFGAAFGVLNGAAHFLIDAVTSRITSRLYQQGRIHDFFVVIGFDQFLHTTLLAVSFLWLLDSGL